MGGALIMATDMLTRKKVETSREKLAVIQQALKDYADRNGRLPCPASREDVLGDAAYGRATLADCHADSSVPSGTLRADNGGVFTRIGAVPARDLLIRDHYMHDEFGSQFTYAVAERLTSAGEYKSAGGSITLNDGMGNAISTTVGFLAFSHGKDVKGAYAGQTGALKAACGATANLDVENCNGDYTFTAALYNDGSVAAKYFDDLLVFTTKAEVSEEEEEEEVVTGITYTLSAARAGYTGHLDETKMRDGLYDTTDTMAWANPTGLPAKSWIKADFGSIKSISHVHIAPSGNISYTDDRLVECSTDDSSWSTLFTTSGHVLGATKEYSVNASCRYIRILFSSVGIWPTLAGDFWFVESN